MKKIYITFVIAFILLYSKTVSALLCYTCTQTVADIDQRCATDPDNVQNGQAKINCNKQYCTSKRVEYKDPPGKIHSFYRGCEDNPDHMNEIDDEDTIIIYYKACTHDLCNGGSGKPSDDDNFDDGTDTGGIIFAPGTGTGNQQKPTILLILLLVLVCTVLYAKKA